jgi:hypothetical protein
LSLAICALVGLSLYRNTLAITKQYTFQAK